MLGNIVDFYKRNHTIINITALALGTLSLLAKKIMSSKLSKSDFLDLVKNNQIAYPTKTIRKVSSVYGNRINPITKKRQYHNGIDIPAPAKTPIYAPIDGEIVLNSYNDTGGNQIVLQNGDIRFGFAHLFEKPKLNVGDKVKKGTQIGFIGTTGKSTGNHLHLTLKIDGDFVDPKSAFSNYV